VRNTGARILIARCYWPRTNSLAIGCNSPLVLEHGGGLAELPDRSHFAKLEENTSINDPFELLPSHFEIRWAAMQSPKTMADHQSCKSSFRLRFASRSSRTELRTTAYHPIGNYSQSPQPETETLQMDQLRWTQSCLRTPTHLYDPEP
jgi:hypothetical protein